MPVTAANLARIKRGYTFLRLHAENENTFTVQDVIDATGWQKNSVTTYIPKHWSDFVHRVRPGIYKVSREFLRYSESDFVDLVSQNRRIFSKYRRAEYSSVVSYEFLLPLTRENVLRQALDSLFYADTIKRRLQEIGLDKVRLWLPPDPAEDQDEYLKRFCQLVSDRFGGYSVSHVSGRFLASDVKTREEAGRMLADDRRYLIDETTAVVRFIIPLTSSKRLDPRTSGEFSFDDIGNDSEIAQELKEVRLLFFNLFAEAIVKIIQGEDEIWLLEDTGTRRRLYKWEKKKT